MKRIIFILSMLLVFILAASGCYIVSIRINQKRQSLADFYFHKYQQSQEPQEQLINLIKSDSLSPTASKKLIIATLYLKNSDPDKAELYLRQTSTSEADRMLTEYYLLYTPDRASRYFASLSEVEKAEYQQYLDLSQGKIDMVDIYNPQTNIGVLLKAIDQKDYQPLAGIPLFNDLFVAIGNGNPGTQTYALAQYFKSLPSPYLAIYILKSINHESLSAPIYSEVASIYESLGQHVEAETNIAAAIKLNPDNQDYYLAGIKYARANGHAEQADLWAVRLATLKKLTK